MLISPPIAIHSDPRHSLVECNPCLQPHTEAASETGAIGNSCR